MLGLRRILAVGSCVALVVASTIRISAQSVAPIVKSVTINGFQLEYVDQGRGTPVLFVHGSVGTWSDFETQREDFAAAYRFVSYSLRYHAQGPWPDDGASYSFRQHLDDLPALIRALNLGRVHLVGWSYGARLAVHAAVRNPELFLTVTALEPGLIELFPNTEVAKAVAAADARRLAAEAEMVAKQGPKSVARATVARITHDPLFAEKLPSEFVTFLESQSRIMPLNIKDGRSTTPRASCDQLKALPIPMLLVRSERPSPSAAIVHEEMKVCLSPGSEAVIIPNSNHLFFQTNPSAVSATVRAFIAKHNTRTVPTGADVKP